MNEIVTINNLSIAFTQKKNKVYALRNATLEVYEDETLALVGESGCGKSTLAKAILKLHATHNVSYENGEIILCGHNVLKMSEKEMQQIRGSAASMVFQSHATSLNPTMKVKTQIIEAIQAHRSLSKQECDEEALRLLTLVQLQDPKKCMDQYPHELSGGMRQRVVIAIALASQAKLLLLDEPTTSLDVTIQAQIMTLLSQLKKQLHMSIILITHDLALAKNFCDRIAVMYAGEIVESGTMQEVIEQPCHPYTKALLHCQLDLHNNKQEKLAYLPGMPPTLSSLPKGCPFHERCDQCMHICLEENPQQYDITATHHVKCYCYHPAYLEEK